MLARDGDLVGPSEWVANTSSFFPASVTTVYGAAILTTSANSSTRTALITATVVLLVASVLLYLKEALTGNVSRGPRLKFYSHLQVWLFFLNCLGIFAAFAY